MGRWQGILPVPLNDIGREQARKLALSLKLDTIEATYTSNLSRAVETAQIIAETLGIPVSTDEPLREPESVSFKAWVSRRSYNGTRRNIQILWPSLLRMSCRKSESREQRVRE